MGDLDQIKNLLNLMTTNVEQEKVFLFFFFLFFFFFFFFLKNLQAWRKASEAGNDPSARGVEELIAALLFKGNYSLFRKVDYCFDNCFVFSVKKANDRAASSQARVISQGISAFVCDISL
jgi:hypothetical protein